MFISARWVSRRVFSRCLKCRAFLEDPTKDMYSFKLVLLIAFCSEGSARANYRECRMRRSLIYSQIPFLDSRFCAVFIGGIPGRILNILLTMSISA